MTRVRQEPEFRRARVMLLAFFGVLVLATAGCLLMAALP